MFSLEWLETRAGEFRALGLVAWGGDSLRRMIRRQQRSAWWALKRRAAARAVRQALGMARPL